jgi:hypothetical protein
VIRTLTANVSQKGMFVRMPEPLPMGTRVALSLEAGGRALALAQAEVVWARHEESHLPGRFAGCGVRFTDFLHPRGRDLVEYLVGNLDRGKPLRAAPPEKPLPRWLPLAGGLALICCALAAVLVFVDFSTDAGVAALDEEIAAEEAPPISMMMAAPPIVKSPPANVDAEVAKTESSGTGAVGATDVVKADGVADAVKVDAPKADVAKSDAAKADVGKDDVATDAVKVDVPKADVAKTDAARADVAKADVAKTDVAKTDGAKTDVAKADVAKTDVAKADVAKAELPKADGAKLNADAAPRAKAAKSDGENTPSAKPGTEGRVSAAGEVPLPKSATDSLRWSSSASTLKLLPAGTVTRAFVLSNPARAVFDLSGPAPSRSHTLPSTVPHTQAIRVGKLPSGTRVVIDLDTEPRSSKQDGDALVLAF